MSKLEQAQDLLAEALQSDLEHGVRWLNEEASQIFSKAYPALVEAIGIIMDMEEEEDE